MQIRVTERIRHLLKILVKRYIVIWWYDDWGSGKPWRNLSHNNFLMDTFVIILKILLEKHFGEENSIFFWFFFRAIFDDANLQPQAFEDTSKMNCKFAKLNYNDFFIYVASFLQTSLSWGRNCTCKLPTKRSVEINVIPFGHTIF